MVGFTGPVLVVNGEGDTRNRETEERSRDLFPEAEFEIISDAAHAPPVEQPESFAAAVRRLISAIEASD